MLRVTIELVPHGDESRKRTLGTMDIINTGKNAGRPEFGDYIVHKSDEQGDVEVRIHNHRRDAGFWLLLSRAAMCAYYEKPKEKLQADGK